MLIDIMREDYPFVRKQKGDQAGLASLLAMYSVMFFADRNYSTHTLYGKSSGCWK